MRRHLSISIGIVCAVMLGVSCKGKESLQETVESQAPPESSVQDRYRLMPIHRLSPGAFADLPQPIARALDIAGFTIPQTWMYGEGHGAYSGVPQNAVRGAFRTKGDVDWAILCSRSDTSAIVVFWRGDPSDTTVMGRAADQDWTQNVDGRGSLGFSREITVASPEEIREKNPDVAQRLRDREMHDGIEEHFVEKGSTILYFDNGARLELFGSD